jgi:hypothetical protein
MCFLKNISDFLRFLFKGIAFVFKGFGGVLQYPGRGYVQELPLFLISFVGGVHNMDKKVTKFSSDKKTKNNSKKYVFMGYDTRGGSNV